jgi:hypothetical protein
MHQMILPPDHDFTNSVVSAEHRLRHAGSQRLISLQENSASQELHHSGAINKLQSEYKRMVLLTTASVFDPLGLLSPAVIAHNIYLQKLWQDKLNWDELFPAQLQQEWNQLLRLFLIITIQDNQEGYLLQCYPHSTTWILR